MKKETKEKWTEVFNVYGKYLFMMVGFYGILSGIILFLYSYIKISKFSSLLFLIPILGGLLVIALTKKRIYSDTKSIDFTKI